MEQRHRALIDKYCDRIVSQIHQRIHQIWPKLFEFNIFKREDFNVPRWQDNLDNQEIVKDILLTIKTRGPHAFPKLISILKNTGYNDLAYLLEERLPNTPTTSMPLNVLPTSSLPIRNNTNNNNNNNNNLPHPGPRVAITNNRDNNENIGIDQDIRLDIQVKKATVFLDRTESHVGAYPMGSNPRGLILIITLSDNLINDVLKSAAINDEINWTNLFKQMGFRIISKPNLTAEGIRQTIEEFTKLKELRQADSCFLIISGPGGPCDKQKESVIVGVDGNKIKRSNIVSYFSSEGCHDMIRKPKVFIFHLYKDELNQIVSLRQNVTYTENTNVTASGSGTVEIRSAKGAIRNYENMLIASSTMSGHLSYSKTGSWFVNEFCKVFMEHACVKHIVELFDMINNDGDRLQPGWEKNKHQTVTVDTVGFKHMFLHPGLFESD